MSSGFTEPKTEDEAQRIKRFLEAGGDVSLKVIETFKSDAGATATLAQSGKLKFAITVDQVLRVASVNADRRVTITFEVSDLTAPDQFVATVYLNRPDASAQTSFDDPAFAGEFGFFVHTHDQMATETLRYQIDITSQLKRVPATTQPLTASFVLLPLVKQPSPSSGFAIKNASVEVLESIVKRKS